MAVASIQVCSLCQEDDISNTAIIWCTECKDFLCEDCNRHHRRSKSSKHHKTLGIDDYLKLPAFILAISKRCKDHDEKYDLYCSLHERPCCVKCIKDTHQTCREMKPLCEALEIIKSSASVSHIERDFKSLLDGFSKMEVHINKQLLRDKSPSEEVIQDLKTLRSSIMKHFDSLERQVTEKIAEEKVKMQNKGSELKTVIEAKRNRLITAQCDLSIMTLSATDFQFLIGLNKMESIVAEERKYLTELQDGIELNPSKVVFTVSPTLRSLANCSSRFAEISVVSVPTDLNITIGSRNIVQTNVTLGQSVKTIHDIILSEKRTISLVPGIQTMLITGCLILPNKNMLFIDYENGRLMLHDKNGTFVRNVIHLRYGSIDLVHVRDSIVAITIEDDHAVAFVDIERNEEVKNIRVTGKCNGIAVEDDKIFVRLNEDNIVLILDLEGNVLSRVRIQGKYHEDLAVFHNNIYCVNHKQSKVYCYAMEGKLLWTYTNDQLLCPYVIAVDRWGFIYTPCKENKTLMLISPNGSESKVLLSSEDGLEDPYALSIDRKSSKLLICNGSNGKAFLYNIH